VQLLLIPYGGKKKKRKKKEGEKECICVCVFLVHRVVSWHRIVFIIEWPLGVDTNKFISQ